MPQTGHFCWHFFQKKVEWNRRSRIAAIAMVSKTITSQEVRGFESLLLRTKNRGFYLCFCLHRISFQSNKGVKKARRKLLTKIE